MRSLLVTAQALCICGLMAFTTSLHAQAAPSTQSTPAVPALQAWRVHVEWLCPPANREASGKRGFIANVSQRMNALGSRGLELVSFTPAQLFEESCFVATFKLPVKR